MTLNLNISDLTLEEVKAATLYLFSSPSLTSLQLESNTLSNEVLPYLNNHKYNYNLASLSNKIILELLK